MTHEAFAAFFCERVVNHLSADVRESSTGGVMFICESYLGLSSCSGGWSIPSRHGRDVQGLGLASGRERLSFILLGCRLGGSFAFAFLYFS